LRAGLTAGMLARVFDVEGGGVKTNPMPQGMGFCELPWNRQDQVPVSKSLIT
jgi:hypothetical protein